ncbi:serine hydrolase domain-containing protein [Candidatus Latescibacterota bacterium]
MQHQIFRTVICLVILTLFVPAVSAQDFKIVSPEKVGFSSERLERLDAGLEKSVETGRMPGGVMMLARDGKVFYEKAVGYRDLKIKDEMAMDDIFRIASMSKPITAVATMMLFEEGAFLLTDPVSNYIPEFANPTVNVRSVDPETGARTTTNERAQGRITIYHLLTHTSGIPYNGEGVHGGVDPAPGTIKENILNVAKVPLRHNPGERFTYGLNSDVLGYLIEVISGMPLDQFMKSRIFDPLGMKDTFFFIPDNKMDRRAGFYRGGNPDTVQQPEEPRTMFSGGGGLRSTAGDYMRFAQMILNGGELDGVRLLSPKTVDIMTTNQIGELYAPYIDNAGDKYGLGFGIRTERGPLSSVESLGILGWDGAHTTRFWIDPQENLIGIFMTQGGEWSLLNYTRNLTYQALVEPKGN